MPEESTTEWEAALRVFLVGSAAVFALFLVCFGLISIAAALGIAPRLKKIAEGYGFVLIVALLLLFVGLLLAHGIFEAAAAFSAERETPERPWSAEAWAVEAAARAWWGPAAAVLLGLATLAALHGRRMSRLPLEKKVSFGEYGAPVGAAALYLPCGGLIAVATLALHAGFFRLFLLLLERRPPGALFLAFAFESAFLFLLFLTLGTLALSLGLRRTFDSWLGAWYSRGEKLIDRPPPMHRHAAIVGLAIGKVAALSAAAWGLTRLLGESTWAIATLEIAAYNAALFLLKLHKDAAALVAVLADLWGMNRLYVWTTHRLLATTRR
jgi:hypothetical protein